MSDKMKCVHSSYGKEIFMESTFFDGHEYIVTSIETFKGCAVSTIHSPNCPCGKGSGATVAETVNPVAGKRRLP